MHSINSSEIPKKIYEDQKQLLYRLYVMILMRNFCRGSKRLVAWWFCSLHWIVALSGTLIEIVRKEIVFASWKLSRDIKSCKTTLANVHLNIQKYISLWRVRHKQLRNFDLRKHSVSDIYFWDASGKAKVSDRKCFYDERIFLSILYGIL